VRWETSAAKGSIKAGAPKDTPARSGLDMHFRIAAERVRVEWLKERVERRKWGENALSYPHIYVELPRITILRNSVNKYSWDSSPIHHCHLRFD
jgi:transposase InsO family protein